MISNPITSSIVIYVYDIVWYARRGLLARATFTTHTELCLFPCMWFIVIIVQQPTRSSEHPCMGETNKEHIIKFGMPKEHVFKPYCLGFYMYTITV